VEIPIVIIPNHAPATNNPLSIPGHPAPRLRQRNSDAARGKEATRSTQAVSTALFSVRVCGTFEQGAATACYLAVFLLFAAATSACTLTIALAAAALAHAASSGVEPGY